MILDVIESLLILVVVFSEWQDEALHFVVAVLVIGVVFMVAKIRKAKYDHDTKDMTIKL